MAPKTTMHDQPNYSQHHHQNMNGSNNGNGNEGRSGGRSRLKQEPPGSNPYEGRSSGAAGSSRHLGQTKAANEPRATPAAIARSQQRRRPTNYTSSYTPPADLAALRSAHQQGHSGGRPTKASSSSRRKCSSLDRSEEEGDPHQRVVGSGSRAATTNAADAELLRARHRQQMALAAEREKEQREAQLAVAQQLQMEQQLQLVREQHKKERQRQEDQAKREEGFIARQMAKEDDREKERMEREKQEQLRLLREQHKGQRGGESQQHGGDPSGSGSQRGGSRHSTRSDSASSGGVPPGQDGSSGSVRRKGTRPKRGRRGTQELPEGYVVPIQSLQQPQKHANSVHSQASAHSRTSSQGSSATQQPSSSSNQRSPRQSSSQSKKSSSRSSNKPSSRSSQGEGDTNDELTEQQRIEEYAGKRALLRLEQELADHSESNAATAASGEESFKSVMDRKKLARVPQVKKSDLIIGEYLGRGNFCDVFEVTWILPGSDRRFNAGSSRTLGSCDDSEGEDMEASMDSLALSCSNDLNLVRTPGGNGDARGGTASRRSVSQIRGSYGGGRRASGARSLGPPSGGMGGGGGGPNAGLRNPNVLALKCLRPAVRAQPRKFVIGAEDLAHETALLACLDHPNIIQLYGRAEGCFSTAFQMRDKNSDPKGKGGGSRSSKESNNGGGKLMSNEGYFIILDRLMTTLTDRIDEWKDECRAINGVAPPDGTPIRMPPEGSLREHLCTRLKVAYCIADALEYLHSRHVVFRDLKPANVGFDCNDCVKMFDFGFATSIAPLMAQPYEGYGPLTETCGTRRYMAPEVALKLGYGKEVDVYSFGMLLWEICALDKPFDAIQSVDEFHDLVVLCGRRPSLNIDPLWTPSLKNLMSRCWSTDPLDRPTMAQVKALLCNVLRDMNKAMEGQGRGSAGGGGGEGRGGAQGQVRGEPQGGNFIHKWRRRVSI